MPYALLTRWRQGRHQRRCQQQLAAALTMLCSALRAGLNLSQALAVVAAEGPEPVRQEFARLTARLEVGASPPQSFSELAQRIGGAEVAHLQCAASLLQVTGGNLVQVLQRLLVILRERARVRERITVMTTQGMASAVMIAIVPVPVLVVLACWMPAWVLPLVTTGIGRGLLVLALLFEGIGLYWMRRMIRITI